MGRIIKLISRMYHRFLKDDILALGAQMAYYLILAFFPFLIFLVALIGNSPISSQQILKGLLGILPREAHRLARDTVIEVMNTRTGGLAPLSGILTLWFASNGIGAIVTGLNKAYDDSGKRPFWKNKLISVVFTLLISIAIIFSFILLVFGGVITRRLVEGMWIAPHYQRIWDVGRYIIITLVVLLIFIMLYRYAPNKRVRFGQVIPGAIFSTIGWLGTSLGFAYYVDNFGHYSVLYGGIGGVMILLIWLYFSAVIILLGGELNAVLINKEK